MLHLTFAPDARRLLDPLVSTVRALWTDPFLSPWFVVPNYAVGKWLKLRLMEKFGCVVAPRTVTIEAMLWEALRPDADMEFLRKGALQQIVCAMLDEERIRDAKYGLLRKYLCDNERNTIDPVKRVQLAGEIARLLLEYEYNRPGVWDPGRGRRGGWRVEGADRTWIEGKSYFTGKIKDEASRERVQENEIWQRDIYTKLFGDGGLLCRSSAFPGERGDRRYLTLPQLYHLRHETGAGGHAWKYDGPPILLFLLSKISHFHRNLLLEMSQDRDIHVFLVNPCAEFWEDVDTTRGGRGRRKWSLAGGTHDPPIAKMSGDDYNREELGAAYRTPEHRLLELWGSSGKESIALWCQAAQYDFDYLRPDMPEERAMSRLQALQRSLLLRDDALCAGAAHEDDRSIRFLAAPEPGREVETLRENLLDLLHDNKGLMFDDIAVYLPDPGKYLPFIHKVFGAMRRDEPGYIPYTILGVDAGRSQFSRAIMDLCSLCGGDFTRARVFSLLRNDVVCAARGMSRDEIDIWETWAMKLGSFRGYDAAHRGEMGDHEAVSTDAHTFQLGIAQLLLGPLAASPVALGLRLNAVEGVEPAPFRDFDTSDKELVERYCAAVEGLATGCRGFRRLCANAGPAKLAGAFLELADAWIFTEAAEEEHCRREFTGALGRMGLQEQAAGRGTLPFEEFRAIALSALPEELPGSAAAWTGRLTFAPLRSGYILPHRMIFILGMDADSFPGYSIAAPINLLSGKRIIGDSDPVRDNRYAFLELVCAARERIVISYQGMDILRDRVLQPSNVVLEMAAVAGITLPDVAKGPADSNVIALVAHDSVDVDTEVRRWDPETARLAVLAKSASPRGRHRLPEYFETGEYAHEGVPFASSLRTTVNDIRKFLENPLEYHLIRSLGLRNEEADETMSATDEPLESGFLSLFALKSRILTAVLKAAFPENRETGNSSETLSIKAREIAALHYKRMCAGGNAPEGDFTRLEFDTLLQWADGMAESVAAISRRFDRCSLHIDTDLNLRDDGVTADFEIAADDRYRYLIGMQLPAVLKPDDPQRPLLIVKLGGGGKEKRKTDNLDLWLYAFLFALKGATAITTVAVHWKDGSASAGKWEAPEHFTAATGRQWLLIILREMLEHKVCEHAPAVWFEAADDPEGDFGAETVERLREIAEADSDESNDFPLYRPRSDAIQLTEARLPGNVAALARVFERLRPILRGKFDA
ncbi:MAG: exodeoxyribonuclease V subunit gamma [Chitinispirillaceae bacterium]|nr:exodeoxyribonuclease V subunit gamma [Chitinispirillaceae bacterium]